MLPIMGDVKEDSNHDKLIEDYLFSGHPSTVYKTSFDDDQLFAKPIQDEDLFGPDCSDSEPAELSPPQPSPTKASPNHTSLTEKSPTEMSPAKLKAERMREKLKEQALANGLVPRWSGCEADGMVEINVHCKPDTTPSKSKIIFDRLLKKSEDRKNSLYGGGKLTWDIYSNVLRKKLCADKRKVWDSFQAPTDNFDDEEEVILSESGSPAPSE